MIPRVPTTLLVNKTPIQRRGWVLLRPGAYLGIPSQVLPETVRIPGHTGGPYVLGAPSAPRDLELALHLVDVTQAQLQRALADGNELFAGLLELEWPHAPGWIQRGVAGPLTVENVVPERTFVPTATAWRIGVTIRVSDSVCYAEQPTRVALSTTARPLPMGTTAIGGIVQLNGPLTGSVDLQILSPAGVLLHVLALRGVDLAAGDVCTIRLDAPHSITKQTALGVLTDVYGWRSLSASTGWWHVSPVAADPLAGSLCRARLTAGTGWWTYLTGHAA